ncbi:hypothetical protein J2X31_002976 [Flavobacterium arsenatis]|uniref:YcxB-like protein domain-containing protein n=1 Tax=Flavobacterium arsenatis TaxID=1484332 RepID=A0ABU1TSV4_9FLAO|nr:hypothetical protein [Flavobacterium arsenatis]MDR6968950.1 hypothetical protein [Flavobacterium arsenatis]
MRYLLILAKTMYLCGKNNFTVNEFIKLVKDMSQFSFENQQLKLQVVKSPLFIQGVLFLFTFLCFTLPIFGLIFNAIQGEGIKFGGILVLGIFSLIGFYMLRVSLWNRYGKEVIVFKNDEITYFADYKWFKDGEKSIDKNAIVYSIKPAGYEDENKGVLLISNGKSQIESVIKMSIQDIEIVIQLLKTTPSQT